MSLTQKELLALQFYKLQLERHEFDKNNKLGAKFVLRGVEKEVTGKLSFFAEGDSWFDFPTWLRGNVISHLIATFPCHVLNWADNGHELQEIMSGKQRGKMIEILSHEEFQFHGILFSAGGNDIVGLDLPPLLRKKEPNMSWRDCIIDERWERKLLQIKLAYEDLILVRDLHSPNNPIFVNGYDYALPNGRPVKLLGFPVAGPWLDNQFRKRNIKAGKDQTEIVKFLIDGFKELQENLESNNENYHFVNTPGTLEPNNDHWGDELHPSKVGFIHIAQKFKNELEDVFPEI